MAKDGKQDLENAAIDTIAVHAGEGADPTTRAHNLPIYQTATFTFETADEKEEAVDGALAWEPNRYFYTRTNNPPRRHSKRSSRRLRALKVRSLQPPECLQSPPACLRTSKAATT